MRRDLTSFFYNFYLAVMEIKFVRLVNGMVKYFHNGYLVRGRKDIILLSHFGLGDQIIIGKLLNDLSSDRKVILPVDSKYFLQLSQFYSYNQNILVKEIGYLGAEFYPRKNDLNRLRQLFSLPIVDVGRDVVYFLSFLNRKAGVSKLYFLAAWNSGLSFTNFPAYSFHYKEQPPYSIHHSYAFIDHHLGTNREIPNKVFSEIQRVGLDLKFNDMAVTLVDQLSTIVDAEQLHFVASAPFCLALVMPCKAKIRVFYEAENSKSVLGEEGSGWRRAKCA